MKNIDWSVIRRSVEGELTEKENALFEKWLSESPRHKTLYEEIQNHYKNGGIADISDEKLRICKNSLETRLASHAELARRRSRRLSNRVAAIMLPFLAASGILLWSVADRGKDNTMATIEPGVIKALIYNMETGEQSVISVDRNDTLAQKAAQDIEKILPRSTHSQHGKQENSDQTWKVIIPRGAEYTLRIPDGTVIQLNSSSEILYNSAADERRVELKGEAYFDVAPDRSKPFIVDAEGVTVKVYGTRFNINTRSDKYINTVVEEGSVSVRAGAEPEKMLYPNDMGVYDRSTGKVEIHQVNAGHDLSWKNGTYIFENRTIDDIMDELSIWYDIKVEFPNSIARLQRFSGSLPRDRELSELLRLIEKTTRVNFEISGRTVIVK